jgi:SAM-dependent methyltransferase
VQFGAPDDIPNLRLLGDASTERVRQFYDRAPFPGYRPRDSLETLRARGDQSEFARLLDSAIPGDARILEMGCGTGQMSIYLARADRIVVGADLTRASLLLGATAAKRFNVGGVQFIETDLLQAGIRAGAFDIVYASGVLHHTAHPREAFAALRKFARPGGMIIVGLYNAFARIPLRLRRSIAKLSGYKWIPFDPVLRDRRSEEDRRVAWLRDQYQHPEEHRYTVGEVRDWFDENGVEFVSTYPKLLLGEDRKDLFLPDEDSWGLETWMSQMGWITQLGYEGGLFVTIGRCI